MWLRVAWRNGGDEPRNPGLCARSEPSLNHENKVPTREVLLGPGEQFEKHRSKLESYEAFCRELGELRADVALVWLLHNPVVTGPIIGLRTVDQLIGSLRSLELKLDGW